MIWNERIAVTSFYILLLEIIHSGNIIGFCFSVPDFLSQTTEFTSNFQQIILFSHFDSSAHQQKQSYGKIPDFNGLLKSKFKYQSPRFIKFEIESFKIMLVPVSIFRNDFYPGGPLGKVLKFHPN